MNEVSIIGLDLAKNVFQAHGAGADGLIVFRRKFSRAQLLTFLGEQPPCIVAMEACAISRLLIIGAVAVVRWAARKGAPEGSWLARMLERQPKMLVAVALALANRMARTAWALMRKGEDYRDPAMATA